MCKFFIDIYTDFHTPGEEDWKTHTLCETVGLQRQHCLPNELYMNWELILYGRHAIYTEIMLPKVLAAQFHFTLNTHHFTMDIHPEKTNKQKPRNQRSTGSVRMILWCWFSSVFWTQSQNEDFAARWGEMKMSWIHSKQCSHSCLTFKKISPSSS